MPDTPLTDEQLTDIRNTVPLGYEGPWTYELDEDDKHWVVLYDTTNPLAGLVATVPDYGMYLAEFIAEARTAVPALLAEVDRLRAERDQARAGLASAQRQAEAAHCRLHHIEAYVEQIASGDDPCAIGLDLIPLLDGPLHPDHLAAYRAARTTTAQEPPR